MGFNTAVMILNDQLHLIEQNADFGKDLRHAIAMAHRDGGDHGGFAVLPSQHADYDQVVVIGGNRMRAMHAIPEVEREKLLRALAHQYGFRLSRIPTPSQLTGREG